MKIILLDKIQRLGEIGDIVEVNSGYAYGSVGTREISEAFTNIDIEIDKSEVQLPDGPIKEIGDHLITIAVHPEVSAEVTVKVLAE